MDPSIVDVWDVAVVGAGACGIAAARNVALGGHSVVVVDKGSRPGGRLACRRIGDVIVDTGPSQVDTDDDVVAAEFTTHVSAHFDTDDAGVAHWTFGRPANEVATQWLGPLPHRQGLVTRVEPGGDGTLGVALDAGSEPLVARSVILTAPAPQAMAILRQSDLAADGVVTTIGYDPTILLVATLDGTPPVGVIECAATSPLESVRRTGWGGTAPAVVATARVDWSTGVLDGDTAHLADELLAELGRVLPAASVVAHDLKVWRYAHATTTVAGDRLAHCEDEPAIILAGDGFGPPGDRRTGIPRAVRSGLAAAALCG